MASLSYPCKPISCIRSLCKSLSISEQELSSLVLKANYLYRKLAKDKGSGGKRVMYDAAPPLKRLQERLLRNVFDRVEYPEYLQGGIRDPLTPRGYVSNAVRHSGKASIIKTDIRNFFPSITEKEVVRLWKRFFLFPSEVSVILAKLCTLNGLVPQGAKTSTHIGNLIFWDVEPFLENEFREMGLTYSRYVDDITISSESFMTLERKSIVLSKIIGMLKSKGFRHNSRKTAILRRGDRMTIHNLNVDRNSPTLGKQAYSKLSSKIKTLEDIHHECGHTKFYNSAFSKVQGLVASMTQIEPAKIRNYKARLLKISPNQIVQ